MSFSVNIATTKKDFLKPEFIDKDIKCHCKTTYLHQLGEIINGAFTSNHKHLSVWIRTALYTVGQAMRSASWDRAPSPSRAPIEEILEGTVSVGEGKRRWDTSVRKPWLYFVSWLLGEGKQKQEEERESGLLMRTSAEKSTTVGGRIKLSSPEKNIFS